MANGMQAAALRGVTGLLRRLGPAASSNLGGWLGRTIGPHLRVSRVADRNLRFALPDLDRAARARVIHAVWDNLGRTAAEFPHLFASTRTDAGPGWEIEGEQHVEALKQAGTPALFFSGHFGNWEMMLPGAAKLGLCVSGIYRVAANAEVNTAIQTIRQAALGPAGSMFPKGAAGARAALAHLKGGGSLALLLDQKMNDGIAIPFFGRPAMTAPAVAQFALRFHLPIVPARVDRIGPARFRLVCEPPLAIPLTGDKARDTQAILLAVNATLERWIRADPSSWLWLHRRWPKE